MVFRAVVTLFFAGTARFAAVVFFFTVVVFFAAVVFLTWVVFLAVRAGCAAVTFPANARKRRIRANREKNTMFKPSTNGNQNITKVFRTPVSVFSTD